MSATFLTGIARTTEPRTMLRRFLVLDAVLTGVNGAVYLVASGPVGRLLGIGDGLLAGLGAFLLVYAAAVAAVAARREPAPLAAWAIVDCNAAWVIACIAALVLWLDPTTAGAVWIPAQALVVAGFAAVQWAALRAVTRR
jgi:hypothetical protein